ncbi:hypothetical protein [Nonomuraea cavernae]|uniref:Uncharacterized protein n=1 Tax=Nonomuraea cavernae TaxID=2045107 RepID=A0A918DPC4_9ACTN|nr:hypothetical protein [Nonomuraea cavernae]MCA2189194.1 hypothetical protein [Nonomuraea cavernae]GGO76762.1 hypothetical protein GCM10012289_54850 [Nonomuraea cavernae]
MRTTTGVLAALVIASACALVADTPLDGGGRTAGHAAEPASRWTLRHTVHGYGRDVPVWLVPTADGGASLFVRKRSALGWSMLRWDGTAWKRAGLPAQFGKAWGLEIGASPSGETIWAAASVPHGEYDDVTDQLWRFSDGRWTRRSSGNVTVNGVIDIAVASRGDAWFVTGFDPEGGASNVLRWSENALRYQSLPAGPILTGISAAGPDDVWVVNQQEGDRTWHWNGAFWKDVSYPCAMGSPHPPCRGRAHLQRLSLAVRPDGHAWAVGPPWADGGSPVMLHWDRARWEQVRLDLVRTGLTTVRADPVGGLWIAARPASSSPYLLNLRDGRWTRFALPEGDPAEYITDIAPVPSTTRLWVQTKRQDPAGPPGGPVTARVYELS